MTDFTLADHGSVVVLTPHTPAAREWVDVKLPIDALCWGSGTVIDPRYVERILEGIEEDGLEVTS